MFWDGRNSVNLLPACYLIDSLLVTAAFKRSFHKNTDHLFSIFERHETGRDADNISIIVQAYQLCHFCIKRKPCSYSLMFIGRYTNTIGATA